MNTYLRTVAVALCAAICLLMSFRVEGGSFQAPRFSYQARLTDSSGIPLAGNQLLWLSVYRGGSGSVADSGTLVYRETATVSASDGVVNHIVGTGTAEAGSLTAETFKTGEELFLQVAVNSSSNVVLPRTRLEPVPFAMASANGEARTALDPTSGSLTISQPGSYYLTGNLTGVSGYNGIFITSSDVQLDLNGFRVAGVEGGIHGILISTSASNIVIRNGTISGWPVKGIAANNADALRVEDVTVLLCQSDGIDCGWNSTVERCVVRLCCRAGGRGIYGLQSTVRECDVSHNGPPSGNTGHIYAIYVTGQGSLIENNAVRWNGSRGSSVAVGIFADGQGAIRNNTVTNTISHSGNYVYGIYTSNEFVIEGNAVSSNESRSGIGQAVGIRAGLGSRVVGNIIHDNDVGGGTGLGSDGYTGIGILAENWCIIRDNNCVRNGYNSNGTGVGILAGAQCLIEQNSVVENWGSNGLGILADNHSAVQDNVVTGHKGTTGAGIRTLGSIITVRGNRVYENGTGIHVPNSHTAVMIQDNHILLNTTGLHFTATSGKNYYERNVFYSNGTAVTNPSSSANVAASGDNSNIFL